MAENGLGVRMQQVGSNFGHAGDDSPVPAADLIMSCKHGHCVRAVAIHWGWRWGGGALHLLPHQRRATSPDVHVGLQQRKRQRGGQLRDEKYCTGKQQQMGVKKSKPN